MGNTAVRSANATAGPFLGPSGAARRLGLSAERIRQLVDAGALPAEKTPLGRLLRVDDVEAFAAARAAAKATGQGARKRAGGGHPL